MAFKSSAQIFGDDGANGAKVPISTSNSSGTASANRGVGFGEQLTSAIANRTPYAIALNTDDLNARLVPFETDGLDAAYRLGTVADAGGGRIVTLDGAAIETRSAHAAPLDLDLSNAHFRADSTADAVAGGGGFEFKGLAGSGKAVARYGFMDRRAIAFNSSYTVVALDAAVTLNASSVGADSITLGAGQFKDGSSITDLMMRGDMVEVMSGPYAGVYFTEDMPTQTRLTVRHLDGSTPSFAADTAATIRMCRPTFMTSAPYGNSGGTNVRGIHVMGLPSDSATDAAFSIVPMGAYGLDGDGSVGPAYAMHVRKRDPATGFGINVLSITSVGSVQSTVSAEDRPTGSVNGKNFGAPAFYHFPNPTTPSYEASFVSRPNETALNEYYGLIVGEPGATQNFTFLGTADGFSFTPSSGILSDVYNGQLIEVLTPSAQAGFYRMQDANTGGSSPLSVKLSQLDGTTVSWPTSGSGTFRFHSGARAGRFTMKIPTGSLTAGIGGATLQDDVHASMFISMSKKNTAAGASVGDAGLVIAGRDSDQHDAFLRCFVRTEERAALTKDGHLSLKGDLKSTRVSTTGDITAGDDLIATDDVFAGDDFFYSVAKTRTLIVPLASFQPAGAVANWALQTDELNLRHYWECLAPAGNSYLVGELRLPDASLLKRLRVSVEQGTTAGTDMTVELFTASYSITNVLTATTSLQPLLSHGTDTAADVGIDMLTVDLGIFPHSMVGANETVVIKITCSDAGSGVDYVRGVELQVDDLGPRNT